MMDGGETAAKAINETLKTPQDYLVMASAMMTVFLAAVGASGKILDMVIRWREEKRKERRFNLEMGGNHD